MFHIVYTQKKTNNKIIILKIHIHFFRKLQFIMIIYIKMYNMEH